MKFNLQLIPVIHIKKTIYYNKDVYVELFKKYYNLTIRKLLLETIQKTMFQLLASA